MGKAAALLVDVADRADTAPKLATEDKDVAAIAFAMAPP